MVPKCDYSLNLDDKSGRMKVAVIGSGLAGLTIGYLASISKRYEVTLYEKEANIGMEAHSLTLEVGDEFNSQTVRLDTPLRAVVDSFYPHLMRLFRYFDIALNSSVHDFSFSWAEPTEFSLKPTFPFFSNITRVVDFNTDPATKLRLLSLPPIPKTLREVPKFIEKSILGVKLALEWGRLVTTSYYYRRTGRLVEIRETLFQFLNNQGYSEMFSKGTVLPLFSVLGSCSVTAAGNYPARIALDMICGFASGSTLAAQGGVGNLCKKLIQPVHHVHLNCPIKRVLPLTTTELKRQYLTPDLDDDVTWTMVEDYSGNQTVFNYVIFATQANHAYQQLGTKFDQPSSPEIEKLRFVLNQFQYEPVTVMTHFDENLLPIPVESWCANNVFVPGHQTGHQTGRQLVPKGAAGNWDMAMDTMFLNHHHHPPLPQHIRPIFQTYNPLVMPNPNLLISTANLQRVIVTENSANSVNDLDQLQGRAGLYFVGSYTYPGIPLLEGCVANSERVASQLCLDVPWKHKNQIMSGPVDLPSNLELGTVTLDDAYFQLVSLTTSTSPDSKFSNHFLSHVLRVIYLLTNHSLLIYFLVLPAALFGIPITFLLKLIYSFPI